MRASRLALGLVLLMIAACDSATAPTELRPQLSASHTRTVILQRQMAEGETFSQLTSLIRRGSTLSNLQVELHGQPDAELRVVRFFDTDGVATDCPYYIFANGTPVLVSRFWRKMPVTTTCEQMYVEVRAPKGGFVMLTVTFESQ